MSSTHAGAAPRGARVNQKMINGMGVRRRQGFTHQQIARHYGVSERTVRRHTKGVSPQLVHAGDQTARVSLLSWGALQFRAIQRAKGLTVKELDLALKAWRTAVSGLDEMTIEQLELDTELRARFLAREVWPRIHEEIDDRRLDRGVLTVYESERRLAKQSGVAPPVRSGRVPS